ncbi:MAG: bifunctional phosphoribosyl-AMP cyclohydrolase/phosphoribosyl-ATP diphosphatase HisIE [Chitinophagaceae bacterium]
MIKPDFEKFADGLVPVIIQDNETKIVLMLGYMNDEAYQKTISENRVVFYSRFKQRLWMKGESSGNYLHVKEMLLDCDNDTILIKSHPAGPVCHTGADTCFKENNRPFSLEKLEQVIATRKSTPSDSSYTSLLFAKGINKVAQKVGEEAVELVIESMDSNKEKFLSEAADLLYHYLILLQAKNYRLDDVVNLLGSRQRIKQ